VILAVVVATLTISWQFLRAWLALFLQDHHGYTPLATRALMPGYFIVADVGCILSGALVTKLTRRGWLVQPARLLGYVIFAVLAAAAALIPFAGSGWLMVALLYIAGAGILGLQPYYSSRTQELSAKRMGILSGGLAAWGWIVSSLNQILVGRHIEATRSYELGLMIVGLAPAIGLIALLLWWPRISTSPVVLE
jgi:ACS family hexuronate transporter-like MFS transporter